MTTKSSDMAKPHDDNVGKREVTMTSRRDKTSKATPEPTPEEVTSAEATAEAKVEQVSDMTMADAPTGRPFPAGADREQVGDTFDETMQEGRERIDAIDEAIIELVIRRMEEALTLLTEKHQRGMTARDKIRQEQIIGRMIGLAADLPGTGDNRNDYVQLNKHQIRELYELLIRFGVENFRRNIIDRRR